MARIDSFETLCARVVYWLDRPDLASRVPDFVNLAEETLVRRLNLSENEVMARLDLVAGRAPLPNDYGAIRSVVGYNGRPVNYVPPSTFFAYQGWGNGLASTDALNEILIEGGDSGGGALVIEGVGSDAPNYIVRGGAAWCYTIIGSVPIDDIDADVSIWQGALSNPFILVGFARDGQITLVYRQGLPPLSDENTSNWLLKKAPDLYLYATLLEFEPFLRNDERLSMWEAKVAQKIDDIQALDRAARWGRSRIVNLEPAP